MNQKLDEIVSADSRFRAAFFRRDDGTYGYEEFRNINNAVSPSWLMHAKGTSRFESHALALQEAQHRLSWLWKEMQWPARDQEPIETTQDMPGWIACPFCGIRFSLLDADRWGGGRHLTCGQRITATAR